LFGGGEGCPSARFITAHVLAYPDP
jgi:hypothetical protein